MMHGIFPTRFVKPHIKSNRADTVDAAAIAKAAGRPAMRLAPAAQAGAGRSSGPPPPPRPACGTADRADESGAGFCLAYGLVMRIGAGGFHVDTGRHPANAENDLTPDMRALLAALPDDLACIKTRVKAPGTRIEAIAKEEETISRL